MCGGEGTHGVQEGVDANAPILANVLSEPIRDLWAVGRAGLHEGPARSQLLLCLQVNSPPLESGSCKLPPEIIKQPAGWGGQSWFFQLLQIHYST